VSRVFIYTTSLLRGLREENQGFPSKATWKTSNLHSLPDTMRRTHEFEWDKWGSSQGYLMRKGAWS